MSLNKEKRLTSNKIGKFDVKIKIETKSSAKIIIIIKRIKTECLLCHLAISYKLLINKEVNFI